MIFADGNNIFETNLGFPARGPNFGQANTDDFDYFFEFEDDDTAPSKRRKTLTMPDESKTWSVPKQLEWLSNHHNLQ